MKKSLLAFVLFFALVLGMNCRFAYAALQGEGTEASPYIISTVADLNEIESKTGYFKLANDIDLGNLERVPLYIGEGSVFDGNRHVLKNLKVSSSVDAGLFGNISKVTIKNLVIDNASVSSSSTSNAFSTGVLVGKATDCTIENIFLKGNIEIAAAGNVGGLVGYGSKIRVSLCQINGDIVVNKGSYIGGFIGQIIDAASNVTLSQVQGTLMVKSEISNSVGGFVGYISTGSVLKSSSNVKITPSSNTDYIGTFVGTLNSGTVSNSFALGSLQTTKVVGFVGRLTSSSGKVINSYSALVVTDSTKVDMVGTYYLGSASQVTSSYFDKSLTPLTTTNSFSRTTLEMKAKSNYTGWDFTSIWKIEPGQYPTLIEMPPLGTPEENKKEGLVAKLSILLQKNEMVQLIMTDSLQDNANYTWVSNNTEVTTVDANGKVTAVGEGVTTITVTNKTTEKVETISVHVSGTAISSEERLSVYLMVGNKVKLTVSDPDKQVTYTSMDPSVATISNDGVVTAVSKGMAIIKAEYDGTTELLYVKVSQ